MAQVNLNLNGVETQEGFDVLPPGWYQARVKDSEIKQGPKGPYILWTMAIVGKPNIVWDNMSLGNDIAMQRLKTMAQCCGHANPNYIADTEELHGRECLVKLAIEKDDNGTYPDKNKIAGFKPLTTGENAQPASTQPTAPIAAPAKPKMPWEKAA